MYKIGTISQKNIFLPLFAYDIIFVEKAKTAKTFLGVFYKNFAKKVLKDKKRGILVLFYPQLFYKPLKHSPKHAYIFKVILWKKLLGSD